MVAVREFEAVFLVALNVRGALPVPLAGVNVSHPAPPLMLALHNVVDGSVKVALPTLVAADTTTLVGETP
jgi:hypothetical protein